MAATEIRSTSHLELASLLLTLALSIASALNRISNLTDQQNELKRLMISPLWSSLEQLISGNTFPRNPRVGHLRDVAANLENFFSGNLFEPDDDEDQDAWKADVESCYPTLYELRGHCDNPHSGSELIHERLCASMKGEKSIFLVKRCIQSLKQWKKVWKAGSIENPSAADEDPNPISLKHPVPEIDYKIFDGDNSTRSLTELVYDVLHTYWPCPIEDHHHIDKLGSCQEAKFCLDPQWSFKANVKAFSVILSGEDILQECKFYIHTDNCAPKKPTKKTKAICQRLYSQTRKFSLSLWMTQTKELLVYQKNTTTLLSSSPTSTVQEMTLSELLNKVKLSIEAKRVIGLVLARTVLHLLGGKWIISPESLDDVSFYFTEKDGKPLFYFDRAFISTKFEVPCSATSESSDDLSVSPFDGLRALGMTLGKIELGEHYSRVDRDVLSRVRANPTAVRKSLLKQCKLHSASPPSTIQFCLDESSFSDFADCDGDELLNDRDFIDGYYKGVIRPLEGWLIKNNWSWKQVNGLESCVMDHGGICHLIQQLGPESKKKSPPASRPSQQREDKPALVVNPIQGMDEEIRISWSGQPPGCVMDYTTSSSNGVDLGKIWFQNLKVMHDHMYRCREQPRTAREMEMIPRVAVLDTGIQLEHPELKPFHDSGNLAEYKDFVLGNDSVIDLDGHGTHVSHLLLKTAPYVRLYHARVFETSDATDKTALLIAQAIDHAVDKWKVDFISMSFAFEETDENIRQAILRASQKNVLLFAAASNNRAERRNAVGYPAREDNVICVNSTKGSGIRSEFSPAPVENNYNFAILGECLEAAWPPELNGSQSLKTVSGTSQATPLLVGIAATILHLTRMRALGKFDKEHERRLRQRRGMSIVLYKCMSKKGAEYNHITPGDLFSSELNLILAKIKAALEEV